MVRVSNNLQQCAAGLLLCAAFAGCGSGDDDKKDDAVFRANLIQFPQLYSAYDGTHSFQLTPSVPTAAADSKDSDPVDATTLKWVVDESFVSRAPFDELPGGILLTTKKVGMTVIKVTATTKGGVKVRGEAPLTISAADSDEWDKGEARYSMGTTVDWSMLRPTMTTDGSTTCGLPISVTGQIPTSSACTNCHNSMNPISIEHTPTQTAGYSNDALVQIFTKGQKPAGGVFNSMFLKLLPMPDCIYASFHTWDIDEDTRNGIIWKLRSIQPKLQPAVDLSRLRPPGGGGIPGAGAAGAPSP